MAIQMITETIDSSTLSREYTLEADPHMTRYRKLIEHDSIKDTRDIWNTHLTNAPKSIFFCHVIIRAIDACLKQEYTSFDAHTTSNCCHGIALFVRDLIFSTAKLDLEEFARISAQKIQELEAGSITDFKDFADWIPQPLLVLGSLYVLAFVREINAQKRMRTDARKLKTISQVGATFCWEIVHSLQAHFSNLVANSYRLYLSEVNPTTDINGAPISMWGSYVEQDHIRIDKRGIHYASCVYSTQVSLAFLIASRGKIALVNDIINSSGELIDRYICLFQGDGHSKLRPMTEEEILDAAGEYEPVIVFGGYVYSDTLNVPSLAQHMEPWLDHFPRLMVACEVFYPQFPQVADDSSFDSTPIIPSEDHLKKLFLTHIEIKGVSASDPSLYCSSHTYPASLGEVLRGGVKEKDPSALPCCFHGLQILHSNMWGTEMRDVLSSDSL